MAVLDENEHGRGRVSGAKGSTRTRPVEHFCLCSSAALPSRHDRGVAEGGSRWQRGWQRWARGEPGSPGRAEGVPVGPVGLLVWSASDQKPGRAQGD